MMSDLIDDNPEGRKGSNLIETSLKTSNRFGKTRLR
jgi:hypothetical protein